MKRNHITAGRCGSYFHTNDNPRHNNRMLNFQFTLRKIAAVVVLMLTISIAPMWGENHYIIAAKANISDSKLTAGGTATIYVGKDKVNVLKSDGTTVAGTKDLTTTTINDTESALYYNSTNLSLVELTKSSNYGTSSSSNRTMGAAKMAKTKVCTIGFGEKKISSAFIIYKFSGKDNNNFLTIAGVAEDKKTDTNIYTKTLTIHSDSTKLTIANSGQKDVFFYVILEETATVSTTQTLYLKPNSNWKSDNAKFAVYYYDGSTNGWSDYMTLADCETDIYTTEIPDSYSNVIFCRMDPAKSIDWDGKWNQTGNLTISGSNDMFTIPNDAWDGSTTAWSTYSPSFAVTRGGTESNTSAVLGSSGGTLTCSASSGTISTCQWKQYTVPGGSATAVDAEGSGATTGSFSPSPAAAGEYIYFCVCEDACGNEAMTTESGPFTFIAPTYSVTHTLSDINKTSGATGADATTAGTDYVAVFSAKTGFALPNSITVTIGGSAATADTDYTWDKSTGTVTVLGASITGDIVITIAGETNTCPSSGTIYSLAGWSSVTNSSDWSGKAEIDVNIAGLGTLTGGAAHAVSIESKKTCGTENSGDNMAYKLGYNSVALYCFLDCPLQEGDIITITSSGSHSNTCILTNSNSRSSYVTTSCSSGVNTYEITSSDILNGKTNLYIWRSSNTLNIKTINITRPAPLEVYTFHVGTKGSEDWTITNFTQVGSSVTWQITGYAVPNKPDFYVGKGSFKDPGTLGTADGALKSGSAIKAWTDAPVKFTSGEYNGKWDGAMFLWPRFDAGALENYALCSVGSLATGATGTVELFENTADLNLYVHFIPDGYGIKYTSGAASGTKYAFTQVGSSTTYETEVVTLPDVNTSYFVGLKAGDDYVSCAHSETKTLNTMASNEGEQCNDKKKIYLVPGPFNTADAKYAVYDVTNSTFNGLMTDPDGDGVFEGFVANNCTTIVLVRLKSETTDATVGWGNKWNQTANITLALFNNKFTITSLDGDNCAYTTAVMSPVSSQHGKFRMWNDNAAKNWLAHFIPYYHLTYDANGGSGAPAASDYISSESATMTISSTIPTRSGYVFTGWNTKSDGTGTDYASGASITLWNDNTVLYAKWCETTITTDGAIAYNQGLDKKWVQVTITGSTPDSYQWYMNTSDEAVIAETNKVTGTGAATNKFENVDITTPGDYYYYCRIHNSCGDFTSPTIHVEVNCLNITEFKIRKGGVDVSNQTLNIDAGANVVLVADATGGLQTGITTYQWYKDNVAISGATSIDYTIPSYASANDGVYKVVVTNNETSCGTQEASVTLQESDIAVGCDVLAKGTYSSATTITSNAGTVTVSSPSGGTDNGIKLNTSGYFELTPASGKSFAAGDVLSVVLSSSGTDKIVGFRIGAKNADVVTSGTVSSDATIKLKYTLVAGDIVDGKVNVFRQSADDRFQILSIEHCEDCSDPVPTISGSLTECNTTTLTAADYAVGADLQWYKNGDIISGATSTTYEATTSGTYTVMASKNCDVTSAGAVVTINTAVTSAAITGTSAYEVGDVPTELIPVAVGATNQIWWKYNSGTDTWDNMGTSSTYTPPASITAAESTHRYKVEVCNSCNGAVWVMSPEFVITVAARTSVTPSWKTDKDGDGTYETSGATVNDLNAGGWYMVQATFTGTDATPTMEAATEGIVLDNVRVTSAAGATTQVIEGRVHVPASGTSQILIKAAVAATASYKACETTLTMNITICESSGTNIAVQNKKTDAGSSATIRYYWANEAGNLARGAGSAGNDGNSASFDDFSYKSSSASTEWRFVQLLDESVSKIRIYTYNSQSKANPITGVWISNSVFTDLPDEYAVTPAITYYNASNEEVEEGFAPSGNTYAELILPVSLVKNSCLAFTTSKNTNLFGIKLYSSSATGTKPEIQWTEESMRPTGATPATVIVSEGSGNFTHTAEVTTANYHTNATIVYSSSDATIATVNSTTGEVTVVATGIAAGDYVEATISATLPASGCFSGSDPTTYTVRVVGCTDKAGTLATDRTEICHASGKDANLTLAGYDGTVLGWYKDGSLIEGSAGWTSHTMTEPGIYYAVTKLSCDEGIQSNTITLTTAAAPVINVLHTNWHIRRGKPIGTPLKLFEIDGYQTTDAITIEWSLNGASYTLNGLTGAAVDGIYQLTGTPGNNGDTESKTLTATITVTNECGLSATATANVIVDPYKENIQIAYIVEGSKGGGWTNHQTSQAENAVLFQYLASQDNFDVTATNGYHTTVYEDILAYYSQYDVIVLTDYMDSNTKPGSGNPGYRSKGNVSYSDAMGVLVDVKPMLSTEAYISGKSNWAKVGLADKPGDGTKTNKEYLKMTLLCPALEILNDTHNEGDVIQVADNGPTNGEEDKVLQGFHPAAAKDFVFMATVTAAGNDTLITLCERQKVLEARLMIFGLNWNGSNYINDDGKLIVKQIIEYLMKWRPEDVADCAMYFNDKHNTGVWSDPGNWGPSYNILPRYYHQTRIEQPCRVDIANATAASVRIATTTTDIKGREDDKVLNGKLTISSTGALTVNGGIYNVVSETKKDFVHNKTVPSDLLTIESNATGQGALAFGELNKNMLPNAVVVFYSRATRGGEQHGLPTWQYIGMPYQDAIAIQQYYNAWLCRWHQNPGNWTYVKNEEHLVPFEGYAITQIEPTFYYEPGTLNMPQDMTFTLTNEGGDYAGYNIIANSFTAPIHVRAMSASDFDNAEATIYIYNTGTYNEWDSHKETIINAKDANNTTPGQYFTMPVEAVKYYDDALTAIPPMQAFYVKANAGGGSLTLDYERTVLCIDSVLEGKNKSTAPLRAPRRIAEDNEDNIAVTTVYVEGEEGADIVRILTGSELFTNGFDNGWDGEKWDGDDDKPQLAVHQDTTAYAVSSQPELEGTILDFRAGDDETYDLILTTPVRGLVLTDLVSNIDIPLTDTTVYTFNSSNKTTHNRFIIRRKPSIATDTYEQYNGYVNAFAESDRICVSNTSGSTAGINAYDTTGKLIYSGTLAKGATIHINPPIPQGVYLIKATTDSDTKTIKVIF